MRRIPDNVLQFFSPGWVNENLYNPIGTRYWFPLIKSNLSYMLLREAKQPMSSFLSSNNFLCLSRLSCARLPLIIAYRPQSSLFYRKPMLECFLSLFFFFLPQLSCMQIANGVVGICSLHETYFFIIQIIRAKFL